MTKEEHIAAQLRAAWAACDYARVEELKAEYRKLVPVKFDPAMTRRVFAR